MKFKVRAVAVTQPLIELEDSEDFIVYAARVSNPSNQMNTETGDRLIRYLMRHGHWSPFEMAHLVMEVDAARDISRQILRHTFKYQEFSQRYADPTTDLGFTLREARLQDLKNRQNSIDVEDPELQREWDEKQMAVIATAEDAYRWGIERGIAKEQARVVLPEGLTMSRMYVSGPVRTWIHYCQSRTHPSTQKEHRIVAEACWQELIKHFPAIGEAFNQIQQEQK